jgi:hypothetical protein
MLVCRAWYEVAHALIDQEKLRLLFHLEESDGATIYFLDLDSMEKFEHPLAPSSTTPVELFILFHPASSVCFLQVGEISCPLLKEQPTLREKEDGKLTYLFPIPLENNTEEEEKTPTKKKKNTLAHALAIVMPSGMNETHEQIVAFEFLLASFTNFSDGEEEQDNPLITDPKKNKVAVKIEKGGYRLRTLIVDSAEKLGGGMMKTSNFINHHILTPNEKPTQVSEKTYQRIEKVCQLK